MTVKYLVCWILAALGLVAFTLCGAERALAEAKLDSGSAASLPAWYPPRPDRPFAASASTEPTPVGRGGGTQGAPRATDRGAGDPAAARVMPGESDAERQTAEALARATRLCFSLLGCCG